MWIVAKLTQFLLDKDKRMIYAAENQDIRNRKTTKMY